MASFPKAKEYLKMKMAAMELSDESSSSEESESSSEDSETESENEEKDSESENGEVLYESDQEDDHVWTERNWWDLAAGSG